MFKMMVRRTRLAAVNNGGIKKNLRQQIYSNLGHKVSWSLDYEPRCEKTGILHMRKQRHRSAVR